MSLALTLLILVVAVLVTPFLTSVFGRSTGWPLAALYLASNVAFLPAAGAVMAGEHPTWSVGWVPDLGINLAFRADGIGVVFTFIALLIGAVVFAYSTSYLKPGRQLSFYLVMVAFTLSMVGLVLADDLIVLFLCWELTSIASFLLIARSGTASGETASMRTLVVTFVGGLTMLAAVTAIIARTGITSVSEALVHPVWREDATFTGVVAVLVLISAFTKSAQFPFHAWLPDAMAAATPVSAYLHAAAVVKAGIFLLMRFTPAFYDTPVWNYTLIGVGLFTAAMGAVFAFSKTDLKKMMAYSTVSQLGLIVATIGVGTELALAAAVLHTIAHALFKSGLFMMVGVVDHAAHTRDVRRLPALRHSMPWSFAAVALGCASMAGIPPMLGFVSKESVLAAMREAPGPSWVAWAALLATVGGAVLTFAYCAKIVFGTFVDGEHDPSRRYGVEAGLLWPAALPIFVGLPLAFTVAVLDTPVARAVQAALPGTQPEPGLALWHGLTAEMALTFIVLTVGAFATVRRKALRRALERDLLRRDGGAVLDQLTGWASVAGARLVRLVAADHATRHVAVQMCVFSAVLLIGAYGAWSSTGVPEATAGLSRPIDVLVLVLVTGGVLGMLMADSRLGATVALGAVGIMVTVQIFALGAPDVGMTQLLVESLTVIVVMLVLQKLPLRFGGAERKHRLAAMALALVAGAAAFVATWAMTGRRDKSDVGTYYLAEGPGITSGNNVVNTILVEFRALDTLGELTVLAMAGVAIIAVLSTVRDRYLDPDAEHDRHRVPPPLIPLRDEGSTAYAAMQTAWGNAIPLQLLIRVVTPVLALVSAVLFWRGHNAPGGGFVAALIGSSIVGLIYLSTARDETVGPPRLPVALISGGVVVAIASGYWGMVAADSFLEPLHWVILRQDISSAIIFDAGVYAAVLGLVMVAFNLLGASDETGDHESTRERVDEAVEGELPGPMDTSRGEPAGPDLRQAARLSRRTHFLSTGTDPGRRR